MAKKVTPPDKPTKKRAILREGDRVIVGSEVGLTLPIGDTTAHLRFSFWSERFAKSDSDVHLKEAAELVDEFNEAELDRRTKKYKRIIERILQEEDEDDEDSPRARARTKLKKGKKK